MTDPTRTWNFPTKGIESELKKLGVEVVDESHVHLRDGWSTNMNRHMGTPHYLYRENHEEVARWTGTCDCCRDEIALPKDRVNRFLVHPVALTVAMRQKNEDDAERARQAAEQATKKRKLKPSKKSTSKKRPKTAAVDAKETVDTKEEPTTTTQFPTTDIESELRLLGVEVIGPNKIRLPPGWTSDWRMMAFPAKIYNEKGQEVLRVGSNRTILHFNTYCEAYGYKPNQTVDVKSNSDEPQEILEPANELVIFEFKKQFTHAGWNENRIMRIELFTDYDLAAKVLFEFLPRCSDIKTCTLEQCRQFIEHPGERIYITNGLMNETFLHIRRQTYDRKSLL